MRSALIIVCNGLPFITKQLDHIYDLVDEIVIVEGADGWFSRVIGSKRSTDGTVEAIKEWGDQYDVDKKIRLFHINMEKNRMVKFGNKKCRGDVIYQIDVDEFIWRDQIEDAFQIIESDEAPTVKVPQRWYYKWVDVYISSGRINSIRAVPVRFCKNMAHKGLYMAHIPNNGYYNDNGGHVDAKTAVLPFSRPAYHYLTLFREQVVLKMKYYTMRGDVGENIANNRIAEFDSTKRDNIGEMLKSYKGKLLLEDNPFPLNRLPGMKLRWVEGKF